VFHQTPLGNVHISLYQFEASFPEVVVEASHPDHATLQSFTIAIYVCFHHLYIVFCAHTVQEVGCLFGALSNLWVGDKLGRRRTIVVGGSIMIAGNRIVCGPLRARAEFLAGAILQTTAFSFPHLIVARIVTGYGNGLIVSNIPTHVQSPAKKNVCRHRRSQHITRSSPHPQKGAECTLQIASKGKEPDFF